MVFLFHLNLPHLSLTVPGRVENPRKPCFQAVFKPGHELIFPKYNFRHDYKQLIQDRSVAHNDIVCLHSIPTVVSSVVYANCDTIGHPC